jgi:hypothetical protein
LVLYHPNQYQLQPSLAHLPLLLLLLQVQGPQHLQPAPLQPPALNLQLQGLSQAAMVLQRWHCTLLPVSGQAVESQQLRPHLDRLLLLLLERPQHQLPSLLQAAALTLQPQPLQAPSQGGVVQLLLLLLLPQVVQGQQNGLLQQRLTRQPHLLTLLLLLLLEGQPQRPQRALPPDFLLTAHLTQLHMPLLLPLLLCQPLQQGQVGRLLPLLLLLLLAMDL